jgi:hypothetical protein
MASESVPLVVVDDRDLRWAVYADDVRAIVDAAGWSGAPPIDVGRLWGAAIREALVPPATSATRVLVVDTERGARALLSTNVSFRTVPRSTILPLPDVLGIRDVSFVDGVLFHESENPVIVLNARRIEGAERK